MVNRARAVVLLVEDDEPLREALSEALRNEGYRVASVADGRLALRWLGEHARPALILLDLWMPNGDGWQLRQELRSHDHLRDIPVVVMTAVPQQSAVVLGVRAVLEKPVTLPHLLETVERHFAL